ncbi:nucleotidyltransferase family protein [Tepidiforma bonchosmolovskayae]|jgi:CTP:molybdopterin cytidylyltransferase MocA|uniref:Nucleotidyltransferase family protein n=1 Tax=Tepidiforma bonchosmolovskayae TaxID=2601677 RepID=A0ABX6C5A0_9CHLR|nr:nucleotidyltransferase family protein [Tepidiforma bonchosmolovskayae]QFG03636.1 nucleotidyltransferase family protein [Tepidiforma bonchosmolovskayae]
MNSAIILAAGISQRMGAVKPLLDWGGQPLVRYDIEQLWEAGADEVIVVLGYRADDVSRQLRGIPCRIMFNPRYQLGRAGSLRIGAKAANRDADRILVQDVDQPRPASFLRTLYEAHNPEADYTIPVHSGRHGHPVVVAGRLREELMRADDAAEGLRGILRAHQDRHTEVDAGDLLDLTFNTPEEYQAARDRFFAAVR